MYKQCKTEQSSQRQRQLEQGLLEAMAAVPFQEITVSGLCARLGIPRKAFYRYFPSKEDALYALIEHSFMDMDLYISRGIGDAPGSVLRELELALTYWRELGDLFTALEKSGLAGDMLERFTRQAVEDDTFLRKYLPENADQARTAEFLLGGMVQAVRRWQKEGYQQTPQELAQALHGLITRPLLAE